MERKYEIVQYEEAYEEAWDNFVLNQSVNGTFLQTRRFLKYHPEGRFQDVSYMIFDKKHHLCAVCPACVIEEEGHRVYYSHKGSTFGGIVIDHKNWSAEKMTGIIQAIEEKLRMEKYEGVYYKITPDLFSLTKSDLLQFCLYFQGYRNYDELNLMIDYRHYKEDILSNFSQGKRTNVHNCEKQGIEVKGISDENEIRQFYNILCVTLNKYSLMPVHSLEELIALKNQYIANEIGFYGAFLDGKMIAGSMMFYFYRAGSAHTQYLCALPEYHTLSPMTYMYYSMIVLMKEKGFDKLSWGITSGHFGKEINWGLTKSKESYGSSHEVSRIYYKRLV